MCLLFEAFKSLSEAERTSFFAAAARDLPGRQLAGTALTATSAGGFTGLQLQLLQRYLKSAGAGLELHRNPEFFSALQSLAAANGTEQTERALLRLQLQAGMLRLEDAGAPADGIYRLVHSDGCIYRVRQGRAMTLARDITFALAGTRVVGFLPSDGLFDDLVGAEQYGACKHPLEAEPLRRRLSEAVSVLDRYAPAMWRDFQAAVSWVVLTPDYGDPIAWSYSGRLEYYGGIFINPYRCLLPGMVESLIHEYYHHRLWLWWDSEHIDGLPPVSETMLSPLTGFRRSIQVMLQALLIYVETLRFHAWFTGQSTATCQDDLDWAAGRQDQLRKGIPDLIRDLQAPLPSGSKAAALVALAQAHYEAIDRA